MQLPAEGYPISTEALREWFCRTHGREATEVEIGELQDAMTRRDESTLNPPAPQ